MSTAPPAELVRRYGPEQLEVFSDEELERFLGPVGGRDAPWDVAGPAVAWELLYRVEPELYDRALSRADHYLNRLQVGYVVIDPKHSSPELVAFTRRVFQTTFVAEAEGLELYRTPLAPPQ